MRFNRDGSLLAVTAADNSIKVLANEAGARLIRNVEAAAAATAAAAAAAAAVAAANAASSQPHGMDGKVGSVQPPAASPHVAHHEHEQLRPEHRVQRRANLSPRARALLVQRCGVAGCSLPSQMSTLMFKSTVPLCGAIAWVLCALQALGPSSGIPGISASPVPAAPPAAVTASADTPSSAAAAVSSAAAAAAVAGSGAGSGSGGGAGPGLAAAAGGGAGGGGGPPGSQAAGVRELGVIREGVGGGGGERRK